MLHLPIATFKVSLPAEMDTVIDNQLLDYSRLLQPYDLCDALEERIVNIIKKQATFQASLLHQSQCKEAEAELNVDRDLNVLINVQMIK